jgi:hypothetical protein
MLGLRYSPEGDLVYRGKFLPGNEPFAGIMRVMLEVDLDASPRTLRFFVDDREQPVFVTHIPQSITFAVCPISHRAPHFAAGLANQYSH